MINMKRLLSILSLYLLYFRVYSKTEVNDYIDKIKKEYPNATHYCYGYVIDNDIKSSG